MVMVGISPRKKYNTWVIRWGGVCAGGGGHPCVSSTSLGAAGVKNGRKCHFYKELREIPVFYLAQEDSIPKSYGSFFFSVSWGFRGS